RRRTGRAAGLRSVGQERARARRTRTGGAVGHIANGAAVLAPGRPPGALLVRAGGDLLGDERRGGDVAVAAPPPADLRPVPLASVRPALALGGDGRRGRARLGWLPATVAAGGAVGRPGHDPAA